MATLFEDGLTHADVARAASCGRISSVLQAISCLGSVSKSVASGGMDCRTLFFCSWDHL
jgi:hypothetical protein